CHSVRSCCAPEALSFQDSLVAIRILVTVIPLGMDRVSGSAPRFPTRITLFTPRAISIPPRSIQWHTLYTASPAPISPFRLAMVQKCPLLRRHWGDLPTLGAARIVIG